jgi:NAD(P)-dependent dehydrogenase (short-subunit alcohol dehydrogenase family)
MTTYLAGKVAVVTGASAGVGRAIVRALGQQGARVGLIARGLDGLEAAAREIRASGGEALVLALDVADAAAVEAAADRVALEWGRLDVWVNNAMISVFSPVSEMTSGEYRRVTEVTYLHPAQSRRSISPNSWRRQCSMRSSTRRVSFGLAGRPSRPFWGSSFEFWMRRHRALLGGLAASALIAVVSARAAWRA